MLPTRAIESHLQGLSRDRQDIVLELRSLIVALAPDAVETLHAHGMSYFHAGGGGPVSAGICQIGIFPDGVRLAFVHGAFLPDPHGLLEGSPKYKKYVRLGSYARAPWEQLRELIGASARFDPYTLTFRS
jgi:hypothetical protein